MPEQNRELKNRVREIRSHGSVRGQGRNGLALLGTPLPISLYCVWQWWERHYQAAHGRPDHIDFDWLDETYLGRQRMYDTVDNMLIGTMAEERKEKTR